MAATPTTPATGRRYRGQTEEMRRAEQVERLLGAALELFGTKGLSATSIEELCRSAGITARHFYLAFPTKRALFTVLYDRIISDATAAVLTQVSGDDPVANLELGLRSTFEYMLQDRRRARITCIESMSSPDSAGLATTGIHRLRDVFLSFYREHLEEAAGPETNVELTALALAGSVTNLLAHGVSDPDASIDELTATAFSICRRSLGL